MNMDMEKPQEKTKENHDTCLCDNCDELIVFEKHGFYILTKKDEELCWCQSCFEDHWKIMRDDLWECDDFEEESFTGVTDSTALQETSHSATSRPVEEGQEEGQEEGHEEEQGQEEEGQNDKEGPGQIVIKKEKEKID